MDIYALCDEILSEVFTDYYHGMPEFAEDEEPEVYAAYTVNQTPVNYASGRPRSRQYWIAVSVFTPRIDNALYALTEAAFTKRGAVCSGGNDGGYAVTYPGRTQYTLDFTMNFDTKG